MAVTQASTKGGVKKQVHSEFDDGYMIGFFDGCDYIPLVFCYDDVYDCPETTLLTSGELYHGKLMRTDGGRKKTLSQEIYTFDWSELTRVALENVRDGEGRKRTVEGYCLNRESDMSLYGVHSIRTNDRRLNRNYWTPGHTTQNAEGPAELFGIGQIAHSTCPFDCSGDPCHHDTFIEEESNIYRIGDC